MKVRETDLISNSNDYIKSVAEKNNAWSTIAKKSIDLDRSGKYSLAIDLYEGNKMPPNQILAIAIMGSASLEGNILAKQWLEKRLEIETSQLSDGGIETQSHDKIIGSISKENEETWRAALISFKTASGVTEEYFFEEASRELNTLTNFNFTRLQITEFLEGVSLVYIIQEARKIKFETSILNFKEERRREQYKAIKTDLLKIIDMIKPALIHHLPTLSLRRSQLLRDDHYGRQIREEWDAEIDYFILHFLVGGDGGEFESLKSVKSIKSTYNRVFRIIDHSSMFWAKSQSEGIEWANLAPVDFETECSDQLSHLGWKTRTTAGSGDQGIDVIATTPRVKLVVQCKRYANSVGNFAVQEIIAGREFEKADFAAVISTGVFTKSAQALASSANVFLLHPEEIEAKLSARNFDREVTVSAQAPKIHDMEELLGVVLDCNVRLEIENKSDLTNRASRAGDDDEEEEDTEEPADYFENDRLYEECIGILKATRRASVTTFERRLRITFEQAARLMNLLEENGIVGPEKGAESREILVEIDKL